MNSVKYNLNNILLTLIDNINLKMNIKRDKQYFVITIIIY